MTQPVQPSAQRIWDHCEALATLSEMEGGLTRVYLSDEQRRANELVLGWMREAGMSARLDAAGNCVGRYEGERPGLPALVLGSHLDTVRDAGKYDGMLGVIAGIECVRTLHARGKRLPFAIEVVGFADEEGVALQRDAARQPGGRRHVPARGAGCARQGRGLDARGDAALRPRSGAHRRGRAPEPDVLAYAELHIEQGPVLEAEGLPVGVVTAINGATRFAVEVDGLAGHAGTVPMSLRQDALAAAAECVLAIERRCGSVPELVGTVGKLECLPGAVNVVPGKVRFTIDVRSPRDPERLAAVADVLGELQAIARRRNVRIKATKTHEGGVAPCAGWLQAQIGEAIAAEGLPVRKLPSGAGHDGMAMIDLADIGMLFVRCEKGISHNPAEAMTLADAATGARVFLRFIENFERRRATDAARTTIHEFLAAQRDAQTRFLAELVKTPSDNPPGDCRRTRERAAALLEGLGFKVERHPVPDDAVKANGMISCTNLVVRERFGSGGPTIACNAHGDVVPPGLGWTADPYGAEIRDGCMYGRGVAVSKSDFATYA